MAAQFKYPLTRQDALACANRFADIISRPAARIDCYYNYCRVPRDPEYSEAACWPGFAEEFWNDICDRILPLFQHVRQRVTPELEHWLFEYAQQQWPERFFRTAPGVRKASRLLDLMHAAGERTFSPLHVAAMLGLPKLCDSLIKFGANVHQLGSLGTPLYCALLGPSALQRDIVGEEKNKFDLAFLATAQCSSIAQEATLHVLLDAGAAGLNITRPRFDTEFSVQILAFLTCLRLRSPALFERLYPPPKDRLNLEDDVGFRKVLADEVFLNYIPWGGGTATALEEFLGPALSVVFDAHVSRFDDVPDFLQHLWNIMDRRAPKTTQLSALRPLKSVQDDEYPDLVGRAVQTAHEEMIRRLAQDPRWDPNLNLPDEDGDASTLLHEAVAAGSAGIVAFLARTADVHALDSEGRTPILLAESVEILEILTRHGAKLSDVDNEGQNVWHLAAANNDCPILDWLILHDPEMDHNLRARMHEGHRTPMAQAIIYPLLQLRDLPQTGSTLWEDYLRGAKILLTHCSGRKEFLQSDRPLLSHAAVEWGDQPLLQMLKDCGLSLGEVDEHGNSPLHQLNFSATEDMLLILDPECANHSLYNHDGLTPLETMFFNTFRQGCPLAVWGGTITAHPAFDLPPPNMDAYEKLLSMLIGNADEQQRREVLARCWERFIEHIILRWAIEGLDSIVKRLIVEAMHCLLTSGCLDAYEDLRNKPAVQQLADVLLRRPCSNANSWWHQLVITTMSFVAMFTQHKGLLTKHFSDNPATVQDILCWIIAYAGDTYTKDNVQYLVTRVFPIPTHLNDVPTMLYVCRSKCSLTVFESFAQTAPRLTDAADIESALEELEATNHAEVKLRYFRNAHSG